MSCASVRKKGSLEPCTTPALRGHSLCGRHARMKVPVLWAHAMRKRNLPVVKIQALVRGWLLRSRLRLAGPGVLCRKNLANDEDMVTCESKDREHPLTYFAFEENGKVWWFNFESLWRWTRHSHEPANPYTKVPLSSDTRKRLRATWSYMHRHRMTMPEEPTEFSQRLCTRWNTVVQVFADNGFVDVHPNMFLNFSTLDFRVMFIFLERDIEVVLPDTDRGKARALRLCQRAITAPNAPTTWLVFILILLLSIHKDPYSMTFMVLSALHRC